MRKLQVTYGLHPLAIESALDGARPPKLDAAGNQLFVVARTARLEGDHIEYGGTAIFLGHHHVISVRHDPARSHGTLREQLETAPALLAQGVDYVLHGILNHIVDGYFPIFEMIEDDVLEMERHSRGSFLGQKELTRIFELRCELTRFQRTLGPMAEVARKLARGHYPCVSANVTPYFGDVLDHVTRVQMMVDGLLQVLVSVFEFSSLLEQQRTGAITRQLAAWAGILAVPTAIAGIYGMNFRRMPELETEHGYFVVLGFVAALCLLLYVRFKRAKWL
jgi:magnesium transporter